MKIFCRCAAHVVLPTCHPFEFTFSSVQYQSLRAYYQNHIIQLSFDFCSPLLTGTASQNFACTPTSQFSVLMISHLTLGKSFVNSSLIHVLLTARTNSNERWTRGDKNRPASIRLLMWPQQHSRGKETLRVDVCQRHSTCRLTKFTHSVITWKQ
jgi:hypothetical protein